MQSDSLLWREFGARTMIRTLMPKFDLGVLQVLDDV